jgi:hypothetical protein
MIPEYQYLKKEMVQIVHDGFWKLTWLNPDGYLIERKFFTKDLAITFYDSLP